MDAVTASLSRKLRGSGLAIGDRLFCCVERSPWNVFLCLACLRSGIIVVPFSPAAQAAELGPVLADVERQLVGCADMMAPTLRALAPSTPLLTLETDGGGTLAALPGKILDADAPVLPDDIASIMFTSA